MDALEREGVVTDHRLSLRESIEPDGTLRQVNLTGWISVAGDARLFIDEWLTVSRARGGLAVTTVEYNYHARLISSPHGQDLFRYDNAHGDTSTLHRHYFDVEGGERGVRPVRLEEMPSLAEVIRECHFYAEYLGRRLSE